MFQRLPIAFAQTKAGDTYENLLNEVLQIICSFEQKFYIYIYTTIVYSKNKCITQNGYYIYEFWKW